MVRRFNIHAVIPPDRQLQISLPAEVPVGPAELVVEVTTDKIPELQTLGDFLQSEFCGMWADRADIQDSVEYSRQLRKQAWDRGA